MGSPWSSRYCPPSWLRSFRNRFFRLSTPDGTLGPGESYTHPTFVEHAPALWKLLDYEPYLRVQRLFCQADELTIHRSAAILRNPGSSPLTWHSDWHGFSQGPPQNVGDVLNRGHWPSGRWFYSQAPILNTADWP